MIAVNHRMTFIDVLRYFGALLLVLAMVGGAGLLARRFGVPGVTKAAGIKRLAVVETLMIGPRQRLRSCAVTMSSIWFCRDPRACP